MPRGEYLPRGPASIRTNVKLRLLHMLGSFLHMFLHILHHPCAAAHTKLGPIIVGVSATALRTAGLDTVADHSARAPRFRFDQIRQCRKRLPRVGVIVDSSYHFMQPAPPFGHRAACAIRHFAAYGVGDRSATPIVSRYPSSNSTQQLPSSVTASSTAAKIYLGVQRCVPLSFATASASLGAQMQQSSSSDSMQCLHSLQ